MENKVSIFECAFLQNHFCELVGIHGVDDEHITRHLRSLIGAVEELNPILIYLTQPDVAETISRGAKERVSTDKDQYSDWIDLVIGWVEKTTYAKTNGLNGYDGVIRFFEKRKNLEMQVIEKLPIHTHVLENPNYDWDNVFSTITEILSERGLVTTK